MALNPLGPVAGAFCLDNTEIAAIMGPVGSAKTTAAAMRIARHAYAQHPSPDGWARTRFAIVRNTGPQLQDTTMKSWLKLFPEGQYGKFEHTKKTHRWRFRVDGTQKMIDAEFIFRALDDEDDVANLLSLEVTGFWFNELREINTSILAHAGRRAGRYPGADLGGCTWHGWIGDTNPWPYTSDLHRMFVTETRPGYKFFKQPGGMDEGAENLENLSQTEETLKLAYNDPVRREQGRKYYIDALRDYTPDEANMYVHCKYGASRDGKPVFVSYNDNTHIQKVAYDRRAPLLIGYDCTGRNPAAVVAQKSDIGQWRVLLEFCEEGMGMKQHAAELKRVLEMEFPGFVVEKITCDPAGGAKDAHDIDMLQIIRGTFPGTTVLKARTNDPATRIEAVDGTFRRLINGEPAIVIDPRCSILRAACISEYHYRRLKLSGRERYSEEPEKITPYADAADALEYLMLGGGEGRATTAAPGVPDWGQLGKAITPTRIWAPFDA